MAEMACPLTRPRKVMTGVTTRVGTAASTPVVLLAAASTWPTRTRLTGTVVVARDERMGTGGSCSSTVLQPVPYTSLTVPAIVPVIGVCGAAAAKSKWAVMLTERTRFKKMGWPVRTTPPG